MKNNLKLTLSLFITFLIIACSTEHNEDISEINTNNLFSKIKLNDVKSVNDFSRTLTDLNFIKSINIVDSKNQNINFTLESTNLFLNGVQTSLSKRIFEIKKEKDSYVITDNSQKFSLKVDIRKNEYYLIDDNVTTSLLNLKNTKIDSGIERNIPLFLYIIDEFTRTDIKERFSPFSLNLQKNDREYEGTGLGYHTNLSDAEAFCQEDHDQILANNPGWWSTGVSYSCAWGEHICVCSSNFYSGPKPPSLEQ